MMQVARCLTRGGALATASLKAATAPRCLTLLTRTSSLRQPITAHRGAGAVQARQVGGGAQPRLQPLGPSVASAVSDPDRNMIKVRWGEGGEDIYPSIWLRDNCQCEACFHPSARARLIPLMDLQLTVQPSSVQVGEEGGQVEVRWSDGHRSVYSAGWLHERAFNTHQQEKLSDVYGLKKEYWGCELQDRIPRASFPELMQDDGAFLSLLELLEVVGLVVVHEVPRQPGMIKKLTERVGYIKMTHYGETFSVHTKVDASNLAYTAGSLDMHGDMPYLTEKPGVQLLHCISQVQGEGGDNLLADSFYAAELLRQRHPHHFRVLADTVIAYIDVGLDKMGHYHTLSRVPVLQLDHDGSVKTVNFSHMARDSCFKASPEVTVAWYEAYLTLRDLIYHPDNHIKYKMEGGDLLVMDNKRLLHGRLGYRADQGERHLEGCYWDWDEAKSQRRVLQAQLSKTKENQEPR